jgi:ribosome-binding factor A
MSGDAKRTDRVSRLIQEELGQMLIEGLKDPRIGFTTVTEVRVSADLRTARVYVSIYGGSEQCDETLAGLETAAGYLRRELGHRLRLKYTPELSFVRDDTLDRARRLDQVFDAISAGQTEAPQPGGVAPALPVQTGRSELGERRQQFEETPPRKRRRQRAGRGPRRRRR